MTLHESFDLSARGLLVCEGRGKARGLLCALCLRILRSHVCWCALLRPNLGGKQNQRPCSVSWTIAGGLVIKRSRDPDLPGIRWALETHETCVQETSKSPRFTRASRHLIPLNGACQALNCQHLWTVRPLVRSACHPGATGDSSMPSLSTSPRSVPAPSSAQDNDT